ncbi:MAG: efflux RND transporter periplasmic adaptor subunit [Rhodoferax sp.]|jgi:membrane fusion protein (multidrug efflux system)|uniref:efflux RND transporter periplasmic adaptor subunit n=1 Tax=Rhodoferax sp. TaxID=50421 RepID=UPI001B75EB4B|nr:efflux RND transporter periplasmic adaptor subunit [Rhodoferax sp.]MBP9149787.1 efflux RND transporter periplasmic adaptor subunit [Rhodoferax sp.]MBP9734256.1 efflux RND transporter periplasmic adaptor subunit [Rhodoferax sp.]
MTASSQTNRITPARRRLPVWLGALALLLVAGAGTFFYTKNGAAKADEAGKKESAPVTLEFAPGDVARVVAQPLAHRIAISGSLAPTTQTTVKASVSGEVQRVLVREGQAVRQGEILADMETTDARSRLEAALADQAERRARLDIAARNRDTNQTLLKQNFISQNAFDQLQSTYHAAQAAVQWADAQVKLARQSIADAVVRAPMSGVVAKRLVNGGERLAPDAPMFQLVDLSRLELDATVPASDVAQITPGQGVQFSVDGFGGRQFHGKVERINPMTEPGSRAIKLFVSVPNADASLRGGMFAQGAVTVSQSASAPVVPLSAVFEEAGQSYVFAIQDGKLAKQAVRLGFRDESGGLAEVSSGLAVGATVVRIRMAGLKVGTLVVMPAAPVAS